MCEMLFLRTFLWFHKSAKIGKRKNITQRIVTHLFQLSLEQDTFFLTIFVLLCIVSSWYQDAKLFKSNTEKEEEKKIYIILHKLMSH